MVVYLARTGSVAAAGNTTSKRKSKSFSLARDHISMKTLIDKDYAITI